MKRVAASSGLIATLGSCVVMLISATPVAASTGPAQAGLFAPADSAVTAALNPAGLARLGGPDWVAQGLVFYSESTFEQTADSVEGAVTDESESILVAPLIYYGRPLNDRWSVGFSGTALGFGEDVADGPTRYLLREWALVMLSAAPAVSYRLTDRLSVGAALSANYTWYYYEAAVFNPEPDIGDGQMEIEADDISFSGQLGLLWEISPRTRIGLNYTSEVEPELGDVPEFSGLGPTRQMMLEQGGALTEEITFKSVTPQSIGAGIYHELSDGTSFTFDAVWIEFSEFGLSEFTTGDSSVELSDQDFEDVWAFSFGFSYPLNARWALKAGLLGTTQFIKDEYRTKKLKLDQIYGAGIGTEYRWKDNRALGLNLNYYDLGEAPVDVDIPLVGNVRGRYSQHYSIGLDFTFRWLR